MIFLYAKKRYRLPDWTKTTHPTRVPRPRVSGFYVLPHLRLVEGRAERPLDEVLVHAPVPPPQHAAQTVVGEVEGVDEPDRDGADRGEQHDGTEAEGVEMRRRHAGSLCAQAADRLHLGSLTLTLRASRWS